MIRIARAVRRYQLPLPVSFLFSRVYAGSDMMTDLVPRASALTKLNGKAVALAKVEDESSEEDSSSDEDEPASA